MYKTIVGIEGMACGMCEEHICSTIKKAFEVNKVKASRSKEMCRNHYRTSAR